VHVKEEAAAREVAVTELSSKSADLHRVEVNLINLQAEHEKQQAAAREVREEGVRGRSTRKVVGEGGWAWWKKRLSALLCSRWQVASARRELLHVTQQREDQLAEKNATIKSYLSQVWRN
jgi:hypothetical protein